MDLTGIEPVTSSMPWKRAPSCATGPHLGRTVPILRPAARFVKPWLSLRGKSWVMMQAIKACRGHDAWVQGWTAAQASCSMRIYFHGYISGQTGTNVPLPGVYRCRVSEHSAAGGAVLSLF